MWTRVKALIIREILAFVKDKRGRAILIMPPLIELLIFTFAATLDVKNVTMGVLNLDKGKESIELVERFRGSPTFSELIFIESADQIPPLLDNQRASGVIFIDELFSRHLWQEKPVDIQLILDGRKSNTAQIIAGYAQSILTQFNIDFTRENRIDQQNSVIVPRFKFNHNLIYPWYNIPCLSGIITMLIGLVITSISVAREREIGTFDQLLVSPMSRYEILAGKMIPGILIGMMEGTIIITAGIWVFGVPFTGSLLYLYFCMFFFVISIVGVGLFLSSLCSTQQQAVLGTFIFMSPAIMLSGYATPIENMPDWLQPFTYLNPLRYYIIVAKGQFLKAMPFETVWKNTWPLMIIGVFTASSATWLFRKRTE
ncbi:MAG: ABC transporter permease [Chlamydiia bacterium]|nr:ABC transporter permease [Chlamydiia bacterium]